MSAVGKGELSKTQSRSRLRLGDMKTLNSPDGNWLRRRNSIPRRIPASRSFAPISLLPFGMERHYRERPEQSSNLEYAHEVSLDVSARPSEVQSPCESPQMNLARRKCIRRKWLRR